MSERLDRIEADIEKHNAAIRDLIVVSRTVLTSIQEMKTSLHVSFEELREIQRKDREEWTAGMKELREAQAETEQKLNILIETVDRIIRQRNGNK